MIALTFTQNDIDELNYPRFHHITCDFTILIRWS